MNGNNCAYPLPLGTRLHEFVIQSVLGRGGVGIAYTAEHAILNEIFVIKEFLPSELAHRIDGNRVAAFPGREATYDKLRYKFLEECQTLIQLARPHPHPNLVQATDAFRENDTVYLCMRFEQGQTLDAILNARGLLTEAELKHWLFPLLDGLAHAHHCGVWHRDIKPSNIFIRNDGSPLLIDFGAAHREHPDKATSIIVQYTPSFAAPEQLLGGKQGPWTDIYAMAATCFAVITGKPPLLDVEPNRQIECQHCSPQLITAINAGLQFDPKARPQSVEQWRLLFETDYDGPTVIHSKTGNQDAITYPQSSINLDTNSSLTNTVLCTPLSKYHQTPNSDPTLNQTTPVNHKFKQGLLVLTGVIALGLVTIIGVVWWNSFQANQINSPSSSIDLPMIASQSTAPAAPIPPPVIELKMLKKSEHPPIKIPEPTPVVITPLSLTEQLNLTDFECAAIKIIETETAGIQLTGYIQDQSQLTALRERLRVLAPHAAVDDQLLKIATPFCDLIDAMRKLTSVSTAPLPLPTIVFNHADQSYHEEDYLVLTVTNTTNAGGYLYLEFVDQNQDAVHLLPSVGLPDHFIAPGARLIVGVDNTKACDQQPDNCFIVSRPHGNNLLMALWSSAPLFKQWRVPQSETMNQYLAALKTAIKKTAAKPDFQIAVNYQFFTTAP